MGKPRRNRWGGKRESDSRRLNGGFLPLPVHHLLSASEDCTQLRLGWTTGHKELGCPITAPSGPFGYVEAWVCHARGLVEEVFMNICQTVWGHCVCVCVAGSRETGRETEQRRELITVCE